MKETNALDALQKFRDRFETQQEAAAALGIQPSYFGDMLRGRRNCSDKILAKLGLRRTVVKETTK